MSRRSLSAAPWAGLALALSIFPACAADLGRLPDEARTGVESVRYIAFVEQDSLVPEYLPSNPGGGFGVVPELIEKSRKETGFEKIAALRERLEAYDARAAQRQVLRTMFDRTTWARFVLDERTQPAGFNLKKHLREQGCREDLVVVAKTSYSMSTGFEYVHVFTHLRVVRNPWARGASPSDRVISLRLEKPPVTRVFVDYQSDAVGGDGDTSAWLEGELLREALGLGWREQAALIDYVLGNPIELAEPRERVRLTRRFGAGDHAFSRPYEDVEVISRARGRLRFGPDRFYRIRSVPDNGELWVVHGAPAL